jgi:hypothetical protein
MNDKPDYAAGGVIKDDPNACHGAIPCRCPTTSCLYRFEVGELAISATGTVQVWDGSRWLETP